MLRNNPRSLHRRALLLSNILGIHTRARDRRDNAAARHVPRLLRNRDQHGYRLLLLLPPLPRLVRITFASPLLFSGGS